LRFTQSLPLNNVLSAATPKPTKMKKKKKKDKEEK